MDAKKKEFKTIISADEGRRRRGETAIQLRKAQKEESIAKRRDMILKNFTQQDAPASQGGQVAQPEVPTKSYTLQDIPTLMAGMNSQDASLQITCVRTFRRFLSTERNPPVQECVNCGALPLFVAFLQRADCPELQFEAAWALTNVASTDKTKLVAEYGAVPHLVQLLSSPSPDVREQSAWCLGNVAGDGVALRDYALQCGALGPLLTNVSQPASISLLRNCTWSLSNFCRGKPQPALSSIKQALPMLSAIISTCTDQDTVVDATWALSYISDGDNTRIQEVVALGLIPTLVKMLESNVNQIIVPALRTLGNIVSGDDNQTQAVINANALPALTALLANSKKNIRKETCWMLSNIAAGSQAQVNTLALTAGLIPKVLSQMSVSVEFDVRKEATWVVSNLATAGSKSHIQQLVEHGAIRQICDLLDVGEVRILLVAIDALEAILKNSSGNNYAQLVDEAEGIEKLENLQDHENHEVYQKSMRIIETYFHGEDESENLAPAVASNVFSFGLSSTAATKLDSFDFNPPMGEQSNYGFSF